MLVSWSLSGVTYTRVWAEKAAVRIRLARNCTRHATARQQHIRAASLGMSSAGHGYAQPSKATVPASCHVLLDPEGSTSQDQRQGSLAATCIPPGPSSAALGPRVEHVTATEQGLLSDVVCQHLGLPKVQRSSVEACFSTTSLKP